MSSSTLLIPTLKILMCNDKSPSATSSQGRRGPALSAFPLRKLFLFPTHPLSASLAPPQLFHVFHGWGAQNWTQHPRYGLTRAERDRIASLDLLSMLFLMLPRTPLSFLAPRTQCQLMDSLVSSRTSMSFSTELLSTSQPQPVLVPGIIPPLMQDFAFASSNFIKFLSPQLSKLPKSGQAELSGVSASPPSFVTSTNLLRVHPVLSPRPLMNKLNKTDLSISLLVLSMKIISAHLKDTQAKKKWILRKHYLI